MTVSDTGEVGNLFRNPGAPPGSGGAALDHAIANGGTWLNAFDGALPEIYARHGFVEVARLRWDPGQEPTEWNHERYDAPDVVFMAHGVPARPGNYAGSWDEAEAQALAATQLQESWTERLHPRGRRGQWVDAIRHAEPAPSPELHQSFTGEDFARALDGFEHGGIVATRSHRTQTQNLYGEVWLNLQHPAGSAPVGLARVTLKPPNLRGERVAELSNMYLREAEQNRGFGRAFTDHLFSTLRDGGVDRIAVEAVSVGGYAWARRGFVWSAEKAAEQRRILQDAKDDGRWARIANRPGAAELERKLTAGEFSSEAELAAYGVSQHWWQEEHPPADRMGGYTAPERERTWLGKELLIGSRWKGERPVVVSDALREEVYVETLHPRGRGGEWIRKFSAALGGLSKPSLRGRGGGVLETEGHAVHRTRHGYEVTHPGGATATYRTPEEAAKAVLDRREAERVQAETRAEVEASHREREQRHAAEREEHNARQAARTWYRFEPAATARKIKDTHTVWGLPGYQGRGQIAQVRAQPHRPDEATIAHERATGRVLVEFHTTVAPDTEIGKPHFSWTPQSSAQADNEKRSGLPGPRSEPEETKYGRLHVAKLAVHDVRIIQ